MKTRIEELEQEVIRLKEIEEKYKTLSESLANANKELAFQNKEKTKRATELGIANIELAFQNEEKTKRATELGIANIELAFQNEEKEKRVADFKELVLQNERIGSFSAIVESSEDAIISKTLDGIIVSWNKAAEQIYGYSENEVIGKNISILAHSDQTDEFKEIIEKIKHGERIIHYETIRRKKNGDKIDISLSVSPIINENNKIIGDSTIARDITDRKQVEVELRNSKEWHRAIVQTTKDGFWVTDMQGHFLEVNETYCRMSGYSEHVLLHMNISNIVVADDASYIALRIKKIIKEGEYRFEEKHRRKDGSIFDVEVSAKYIPGDNDRMVYFLHDITERKKTESKLLFHSKVLANLNSGVLLIRVYDGIIVYTNLIANVMLGYEEGELIGKNIMVINAPTDKNPDKIAAIIQRDLKKNNGWIGEIKNKRKDGTTLWCYAIVSKITHPEFGMVWIAEHVDITDRKKAEEKLSESEENYSNLINTANETIIVTQDGFLRFFNPAILELLEGYSEQYLYDNPFTVFIHEDDRNMVAENHRKRIANERVKPHYNFRVVTRSGIVRWVEIKAALIEWQGKPATLNFLNDITERKHAEELLQHAYANLEIQVKERTSELAEANAKLQIESDERQKVIDKEKELNLIKNHFVSVISHEFRTPLTGIKSSVQLFERYGDTWNVEKKQKFFNIIYNSIRFANLLLDDISIIGKDENGKTNYYPSLCLIEEVCQQALDDIKAVFGNSITINFTIKPNSIKTLADESLLRHILNNILSNALKYSGHEKQIDFSVIADNDDTLGEQTGTIIFTITDHGIGIPEKDQKYIFEPFHRTSNVESIKGTGLGLSIVKRCVEMHGGAIDIKSAVNKGTTVSVKIPYKKPGGKE